MTADSAQQSKGRSRPASRYVAIVMIVAALVSALLIGAYNYYNGRALLGDAVNGQLVDVATNRAQRIEVGLQSLADLAATYATEPSVAAALVDLSAASAMTTETLEPDQEAELEELYRTGIEVITPPGVTPPSTSDLLPTTPTARYLQYWYVAQAPPDERRGISDAGDGSAFSEAHVRHHEGLVTLADALGIPDLLLVDLDGNVVYSIEKRADFATSLASGPYSESGVAEAVATLATAAVGEVVIVDFETYLPTLGLPQLWVATAVRNDDGVVGALATRIANQALVDLVTAEGNWEALGLGDTGEVYIVGPDGLMRTESRLWLEDPEAYLSAMEDAGYPADTIEAVRAFETTVLLQPVETAPVEAALRDDRYQGTSDNYLGARMRSVAGPFDSGGLGWVIVTEAETSEIFAPLRSYLLRLLVVAAITIPIVIGIAVVVSRRMLRPIEPIVAGADRVASGDIDVTLAMRGNDEFSDLAGQFDAFVAELRRKRAEVARTDAETTELLASVMPQRLVEQYQRGERDIAEAIRNASLVAIAITAKDGVGLDDDEVAEYSGMFLKGLEELMEPHDAERIDSYASTLMYAVGLGLEQLEVDRALDFASEVRRLVDRIITEGEIPIDVGVGVAAGDVVANVVGTQRLTFEVLGTPRRAAENLAQAATDNEVLVDAVVAGRAGSSWSIERVEGLLSVNGVPLEGWRLAGQD